MESGYALESLFYPQPSVQGVLARSLLLPPECTALDRYTCTQCKVTVKQYSRLRSHIIYCGTGSSSSRSSRHKADRAMSRCSKVRSLSQRGEDGRKCKQSSSVCRFGELEEQIKPVRKEESLFTRRAKHSDGILSGVTVATSNPPSSLEVTFKYSVAQSKSGIKMNNSLGVKCKADKKGNYALLYNPAEYCQGHYNIECLDVHQCQGCSLKFKSLPSLECHAKYCSGKDKFTDHKPQLTE